MKSGTAATATREREILDLYLAGYGVARSIHPTLLLRGSRVLFSFPDSKAFQTIESDYYRNAVVGVLDFATAIRRLRSEMLGLRDRDGGGRR